MRILLLLLLLGCAVAAEPAPDGFYRVLRTSATDQEAAAGELKLRYDPTFLDPGENAEEVVIVRREPFVPLLLSEPPSQVADSTQRTRFWLGVSLTPEAAARFEEFTRENLGQRMAIVVGGQVITMHGIKDVIRGGKVQISRCGDQGCEVLFRELKDNVRR